MPRPIRYEAYRTVEGLSPAARALLAYVRDNDFVTYAEMPKVLAPFIPVEGWMAAEVQTVPHLVLWVGMSEEWVTTLNELFEAGLLWREPCSLLCYLVDGAVLQMPLAKRPPKHGYATDHWVPSCVRPIEHIAPQARQTAAPPRSRASAGGAR